MKSYKQVTSSWIHGWGYDTSAETLYVGTKSGKYYAYDNTPKWVVEKLEEGGSQGQVINELKEMIPGREIAWEEIVEAFRGAANAPAQKAKGKKAGNKQFKVFGSLADALLPNARRGLFSF